eukprot:gene14402-12641_t
MGRDDASHRAARPPPPLCRCPPQGAITAPARPADCGLPPANPQRAPRLSSVLRGGHRRAGRGVPDPPLMAVGRRGARAGCGSPPGVGDDTPHALPPAPRPARPLPAP